MFRWNLMLRTLFGLRYDQAKAHRAKKTVKLHLEVLEDRTVPSALGPNPLGFETVASPPPVSLVATLASPAPAPSVAVFTSSVFAMMDHLFQFMATAEQEFLGDLTLVSQEFAQLESSVRQQVGRFLGNNSNAANPALNSTVTQPGNDIGMGRGNSSGAGSGKGAMTTANDGRNQQLNTSTQQSGQGSGSGSSSTATHGNIPASKMHPLTSGTGSGSGSGSGFVPQVYFGAGSYSVPESGSGSGAELEVELSAPTTKTVMVSYQTSDATATAGTDYIATSGTLTFQPGVTSQYITVPILDDGAKDDNLASESFTASLTGASNATVSSPSTTIVSIVEQATVTGQVWLDANGDGYNNNSEKGFSNLTVSLYYSIPNTNSWQLFQDTLTKSNPYGNNYQFIVPASYLPDNFEVLVGIPPNFTATYITPDSVIGTNGFSPVFALAPGVIKNIPAGVLSMTVSTTDDDPNQPIQNQVTLRDAIQTGNNGGGPLGLNKITFIPNGTIALQKTLDPIKRSYDIVGPGSSNLTVNGNNNAGTIFTVNAGVTSTISGLTIAGGAGANGGGINNSGNLTLSSDTVTNNQAPVSLNGGNGGGIYNAAGADLQLQGVSLSKNTASVGGGLYNLGTVTICCGSVFDTNTASSGGGGIANFGGTIETYDSTSIKNNKDTGFFGAGVENKSGTFVMNGGGSIFNNLELKGGGGGVLNSGTMTLSGVYVQNNLANSQGGGIYAGAGKLTLTGVTIGGLAPLLQNAASDGGGMFVKGGTVKMTNGVISSNSAFTTPGNFGKPSGGGVYVSAGSLTLTKVTVSGNKAKANGGGVDVNGGTVKVTGGTITKSQANNGAGIYVYGGILTLKNDPNKIQTAILNNNTIVVGGGNGGGMYIAGGTVNITAPPLGQGPSLTIENNTAQNNGGGIYNLAGSLTLNGNIGVENNTILNQGGGLYLGNRSTTNFAAQFTLVKGNTTAGGARNGVYEQNGYIVINPNNLNDGDDQGGNPLRGP